MKTWTQIGAGVAVLTLIGLTFLPFGTIAAAQQMDHMGQRITEAKTPADHEALAAVYEKEAQAARQKQAEHLQMRDAYAQIQVLRSKTGAIAHCNDIAKKYEEIAKENEALAKMHQEMAKPAK